MENKKSKLSTLKKAWKEPKKHAIICLVLYGIFFLSLFIWFEISSMIHKNNSNEEDADVLYNYKGMNNYEYNYTINNDGTIYLIDGKVYEDKEQLSLKNTKESVYIENNQVKEEKSYLSIENRVNIYLDELRPEKIYNILKSIDCITEDERIVCNTDASTLNQIFINKYDDNKNVEIVIYKSSNEINRIDINIENNSIEIEYINIGNVIDFDYTE